MDAVTFTRASNGNYVKPDGTLSSHANQGALGNNLLTFPQDFDNGVWSKARVSVVANVEIAPNGTLTADIITGDGTSGTRNTFQTHASVNEAVFSVHAKAGTNNFIQILTNFSANGFVNFDLSNGTLSDSTATGTITDLGDGWYRCIAAFPAGTAFTASFVALVTSISAVRNESNTLATSVALWGAQLEQ